MGDGTFHISPYASSSNDVLYRHRGAVRLFSPPKDSRYYRESDIEQSKMGGGVTERKSGSSFSPVLQLWLLQICLRLCLS